MRVCVIFAVLPILPSLIGIMSVIPAILAGAVAWWQRRSQGSQSAGRNKWLRFWFRQTPSILMLIALGLAARWGWATWIRDRTQPAVSVQAPVDREWIVPRGNLRRSGCVDSVPVPRSAKVSRLWQFRSPGTAFYSTPLPHGDQVYVVGSRENVGTIYALSKATGALTWSCRPEGYRETLSSPIIQDDVLYVGEGLHHTRQARLVALGLAGERTSQVLWTYPVQGHLECTPTIEGDRIYLAAGDDGVYCLKLSADRAQRPSLLWHVPGDRLPDVDLSLTVFEDRVYVGSGTGGQAMIVLDAVSGREVERWPMRYPVRSLPAIVDGRMAICAGRGDLKSLAKEPGQLTIRCLSTEPTCRIHFLCVGTVEKELPGVALGGIVADSDGFLCGCSDGTVRRYAVDGTLVQSWQSGAPIASSLVVDEETIVVHNRAGRLWGLDRSSLRPLWSYRMGPSGYYVGSPIAANGRIFIGTDEDGVLCLGIR